MKKLFSRFAAPLFLFVLILGIAQFSHAAFPGKHQKANEITNVKGNESVSATVNDNKTTTPPDDNTILLVILAIILPPLAVYLKYDEAGKPFIINIILTLLCGLPGIIHALYHVLKK